MMMIADTPFRNGKRGVQHVRDRIGLHRIADAEAGQAAEQRERRAEPGPVSRRARS